jgi:hypothetical protein
MGFLAIFTWRSSQVSVCLHLHSRRTPNEVLSPLDHCECQVAEDEYTLCGRLRSVARQSSPLSVCLSVVICIEEPMRYARPTIAKPLETVLDNICRTYCFLVLC